MLFGIALMCLLIEVVVLPIFFGEFGELFIAAQPFWPCVDGNALVSTPRIPAESLYEVGEAVAGAGVGDQSQCLLVFFILFLLLHLLALLKGFKDGTVDGADMGVDGVDEVGGGKVGGDI